MVGIISFIGWLIIGAIIGWIAGKIWVGHGFGLLGNILVGHRWARLSEAFSLAGCLERLESAAG